LVASSGDQLAVGSDHVAERGDRAVERARLDGDLDGIPRPLLRRLQGVLGDVAADVVREPALRLLVGHLPTLLAPQLPAGVFDALDDHSAQDLVAEHPVEALGDDDLRALGFDLFDGVEQLRPILERPRRRDVADLAVVVDVLVKDVAGVQRPLVLVAQTTDGAGLDFG
jgi:hypothetical protein